MFGPDLLEPQRRRQDARRRGEIALPDLRAEEPANLSIGGDGAPLPRRERAAGRRFDQRDVEAVRIGEREDAAAESRLGRTDARAVALQPLGPFAFEVEWII